ncbi:hypothetical protein M0R04_06795 [Candidatus Dojkabacteria bacterium]|jgi:calcineurin-like phosphoesterase family protein|nr:hypothetical protein [Candidatus Dojkabacteria bacterium]
MKFTNETLLEYYLEDLKGVDTTHNGNVKNRHPEYWDIPSTYKHRELPMLIDPFEPNYPLPKRNIWFLSDTHFNHKNIIKYSNRPFPTIELMTSCLIGNHNNVVEQNDIVIWCGDVTFGDVHHTNELINAMPGYKIHIIGNHDMDRKGKLNALSFDERHSCIVIDVVDAEVEYQLLVTHYPLTVVPAGCINIHGHCHNSPALSQKHINVCVERTNYTPLNMNVILDKAKIIMELYE